MPLLFLKASCNFSRKSTPPHFTFTATTPSLSLEQGKPASPVHPGFGTEYEDGSYIMVQVDLIKQGNEDGSSASTLYDLQLKCESKSPNQFLKALWVQYKKEVKISVSLFSTPYYHHEKKQVLSVENMTIDKGKFTCRGSIGLHKSSFWEAVSISSSNWYMIIIVNIPEKERMTVEEDEEAPTLSKLLEMNVCSDLVITAKNGVKVEAHRCILAVHSPVFLANFKSGMKESQTGELDMSDVSEEAVRALLDFFYKDDLTKPKENLELAFELLRVSHRYQMQKLEGLMKKRLMEARDEDIGTKLAYEIYEFLSQTESEAGSELKTKIVGVLLLNLDEFIELPAMQELFEKTLKNGISAVNVVRDLALADPPKIKKRSIVQLGNGSGDQKRPQDSS